MDYKTTIPIELFNAHESDAVIFTCLDPRFFEKTFVEFATADKSQGGLGLGLRDPLPIPGVCKGLAENNQIIMDYARYFFDLVISAHNIKQIIVVHHPACAAYGIKDAKQESKVQRANIKTGTDILREWYPAIPLLSFIIEAGEPREGEIPLTYVPV